MKPVTISIAEIYVPSALRAPIKGQGRGAGADTEKGQLVPILVRPDKGRYVLVAGLHRMEALKALGETTIIANLVQARKH
jgi:uncharacterized ParB-like nuclease family protein